MVNVDSTEASVHTVAAGNVEKFGWLVPEIFLALITISMVMGAVSIFFLKHVLD